MSKLGLKLSTEDVDDDICDVEKPASTNETTKDKASANDDQRRKNGDFSVYKYYLASSGYLLFFIYLAFMVGWMFLTEFSGKRDAL